MKRGAAAAAKTTGLLGVLIAVLSAPVLAALIATIVVTIGALCWIVTDTGRAERLAMLIHATRGTHQPGHRRLRSGNRSARR